MRQKERFFIIIFAIFGVLSLMLIGCNNQVQISVKTPLRGSMQEKEKDVSFLIEAQGSTLIINGKTISGDKTFKATIPAVEGLGFVKLSQPDDPMIAVRSWHQGSYHNSTKTLPQSLFLSMGGSSLNSKNGGLAPFVEKTIAKAELAPFVDNPIEATATIMMIPITVQITVKSAITANTKVIFQPEKDKIKLDVTLNNLTAKYDATAVSFTSSGSVLYKTINIKGILDLTLQKTSLKDTTITLSKPTLKDSGGLPSELVTPVLSSFDDEIKKTIKKATQKVVELVVGGFLNNNKPQLSLTFKAPLKQSLSFTALHYQKGQLQFSMTSLITAQSSKLAGKIPNKKGGVMLAPTCKKSDDNKGLSLTMGSLFFHQLAFAVWDAGNFDGLSYTKESLEKLGLPKLDFPYDKLESVNVTLLLPPLLRWEKGLPWLDLGGIQIDIKNSIADPMRAWTALSIPIKLELNNNNPTLQIDKQRKIINKDVEFEKLSQFVDQKKILQILSTTIPNVIKEIFTKLPIVKMPAIQLPALNGKKGLSLQPTITNITIKNDCWHLNMSIK